MLASLAAAIIAGAMSTPCAASTCAVSARVNRPTPHPKSSARSRPGSTPRWSRKAMTASTSFGLEAKNSGAVQPPSRRSGSEQTAHIGSVAPSACHSARSVASGSEGRDGIRATRYRRPSPGSSADSIVPAGGGSVSSWTTSRRRGTVGSRAPAGRRAPAAGRRGGADRGGARRHRPRGGQARAHQRRARRQGRSGRALNGRPADWPHVRRPAVDKRAEARPLRRRTPGRLRRRRRRVLVVTLLGRQRLALEVGVRVERRRIGLDHLGVVGRVGGLGVPEGRLAPPTRLAAS